MTKTQALAFFRTTTAIATALRISYQAVHRWEAIPPLRQLQLERLSQGQLQADPEAGGVTADLAQTIPPDCHSDQTNKPAGDPSSAEVVQ